VNNKQAYYSSRGYEMSDYLNLKEPLITSGVSATQGRVAEINRTKRLILSDKKKSHFFLVAL